MTPTPSANDDLASRVEAAKGVLATLRPLFQTTTVALAQACAVGGELRADLLDARQLACYELALAGAELLAAETA
ncbi:MAG: hypothetical protein ABIV63_19410, partial [Caldimonas sp.]